MTREEAKNILSDIKVFLWNNPHGIVAGYRYIDVYDAITALSQEPQSEWERDHEVLKAYADGQESMKPCKDAISRQAAIDAVEKTKSAMTTDGEIYVAKINAEMNIQQLPSISTEKTGHWEMCEDADGLYGICSVCEVDADFRHYGIAYKYCPQCGAKMAESEDKE